MIQGCMSSLREATPIILTPEERAELETLARSTKTEHRTRFKARIGGRGGDAGDWPRAQVHDWDGVEMAGALCERSSGRLFRDRQSRGGSQIRREGRPAHLG